MKDSVPLSRCLACGGANLETFLDLGNQPLANSCHEEGENLPSFPLGARVCVDCWHSQLPVAVNPDLLFKHYLYVSGTTHTLKQYFEDFVQRVEADFPGRRNLRVLDIASNDGSLLAQFRSRGHSVQGVDPAENIAPMAEQNGVPTIVDYWREETLARIGGQFDVIVAMNVLAHVSSPSDFLKLCRRALKPTGRIYIQTSQALMVRNAEFDTIYHEHHSFFSVASFLAIASRTGLKVAAVHHVPVHGTSYLVELIPCEDEARQLARDFDVGRMEESAGYYDRKTYGDFGDRAKAVRDQVRRLISWHRSSGYKTIGYGVAAKGMTFVNFAEIDFDYIVDDNPMKVGLLTPGRNIRIASSVELGRESGNILYVVLAWNFYGEIVEKIRAKRRNRDDAFLTYFPEVTLKSYP